MSIRQELFINTAPEAKLLILILRFGNFATNVKIPFFRHVLYISSKVLNLLLIKFGLNTDIPASVRIGKNVNFQHPFGIVIHPNVVIGENAVIRQQVTIGGKAVGRTEKIPKIGSNVEIGAGAKIIGDILIGDNVIIGANSVVTKNVKDNDIVAGVPAKSLKK